MNIFFEELRINRKGLLYWCLTMLFLVAASVGKTAGMVLDGGGEFGAMLLLMPKPIRALFGLGVVDFSKAAGIFAIVSLYIALIAAFHASGLGVACFAREERDRTFEFLYVRGRTRARILGAKLLADLLQLLILNSFTYLASVGIVLLATRQNIAIEFLPMMAGIGVLQLVFYALGLLACFLTRRMRTASGIASGVVMALFLTGIAAAVLDSPALARISPFAQFDGKSLLVHGLPTAPTLAWLTIAATMAALSFRLHASRDLHT